MCIISSYKWGDNCLLAIFILFYFNCLLLVIFIYKYLLVVLVILSFYLFIDCQLLTITNYLFHFKFYFFNPARKVCSLCRDRHVFPIESLLNIYMSSIRPGLFITVSFSPRNVACLWLTYKCLHGYCSDDLSPMIAIIY